MPQSRKRPGHHEHHKPSPVPASQRTRGRIIWALLFAIFGGLIAFFATENNWIVILAGLIIGGYIGYTIGKTMEKEVV